MKTKFKTLNRAVLSCFILLGLVSSSSVYADRIGNGGGAWVCQNNDSIGTLRWAKLVDLYEGRTEFFLDIPEVKNRDYLEIVEAV